MKIKACIRNHLINLKGPNTRKYVIFESDDWGSERMPDRITYDSLTKLGYNFDQTPYEKYDSIARVVDLEHLFDVLQRHKDYKGNHPIITALTIVANPDFDSIKRSGFNSYHYLTIDKTFAKYDTSGSIMKCWKEGMNQKLFFPQFHGREHINVCHWLKDLKILNNDNRLAFDYGIPGFFERDNISAGVPFARAYRSYNEQDSEFMISSVIEGLAIFDRLFGYKSLSAMAPAYTWGEEIERAYKRGGIKYIQSAFFQNYIDCKHKHSVIRHYFGQRNKLDQFYLLRNCLFEPAQNNYAESVVDECLKEMSIAFFHHKPATISTHRLNYIGAIFESNRYKSLRLLDVLLTKMLKLWPDIEFINSAEMGEILESKLC